MQGAAHSVGVLFKAIGPLIAGAGFATATKLGFPFLVYWFFAFVYLLCVILAATLPKQNADKNEQEEEEHVLKHEQSAA